MAHAAHESSAGLARASRLMGSHLPCMTTTICAEGGPVTSGAHPVLLRWIEERRVVSACPEMLGGLGTPRPPAEIVTGNGVRRVITSARQDVTRQFEDGAQATLGEAMRHDARVAILKSGSPSCARSFTTDRSAGPECRAGASRAARGGAGVPGVTRGLRALQVASRAADVTAGGRTSPVHDRRRSHGPRSRSPAVPLSPHDVVSARCIFRAVSFVRPCSQNEKIAFSVLLTLQVADGEIPARS